jgi:hypothetical protein
MVGDGNGSGVSGQKEDDKDEVSPPPPPPPHLHRQQIEIRGGERIVFTEEGNPNQYLKLVASGDVDDTLLEALEDFVKRQRKRLARSKPVGRHDEEEEE